MTGSVEETKQNKQQSPTRSDSTYSLLPSGLTRRSDMSNGEYEIVCSSSLRRNCIPSGRQLHRSPLSEVKGHLYVSNGESNESLEEPQEETMEPEAGARDQDNNDLSGTCDDTGTVDTKAENVLEPNHLDSMLKGMKGYELTESDLEFIKKMKEEELLKKQQRELEEVQRSLEQEMLALELASAAREKAQAEMNKLPSCEELMEWAHVVLNTSSESTDLTAKSLLAMVTEEKVQSAMDKKRIELSRMQKMLANREKKVAKQKQQLEKEIAAEQLQIQACMKELSDLRSELAHKEEACEALEIQIKTEGKKHQGKKREGEPAEKPQDATDLPVAGEQKHNVGLRRSKRIASRS